MAWLVWAGLGSLVWADWAGLTGLGWAAVLECEECGGNESYPGQRQGSHRQCGDVDTGSPPSLLQTPGTWHVTRDASPVTN